MKRWLMLGCALALVAGPVVAAPATGTPGVYTTAGGQLFPATITQAMGLENGNGALCLIGSDTTCQLPAPGGGAVTATITGPLGRQADAASVAVGLSNEDVAILQSSIPVGTNTIGNVNVVTNNAATGLIQATASVPITFTAAGGPTQIIAANGSTKIYITHIDYVLSGAGTFALITGTGTNCGTNTAYLEGAAGHPLSYAANGGISAGSGIGPIYVTGAGGEICAITTGAVDTSGHIAYAQF